MNAFFTFACLSLFSLMSAGFSDEQNCSPSIAVSSKNRGAYKLSVSKADTIDIRVACLECPVVAESKNIKITPIGKDSFIFKPKSAGIHKISVYTLCPEGTTIILGGNKMNFSGKMPIGDFKEEVQEK